MMHTDMSLPPEDYLEKTSCGGEWCTTIEMCAFAHATGISVNVFAHDQNNAGSFKCTECITVPERDTPAPSFL